MDWILSELSSFERLKFVAIINFFFCFVLFDRNFVLFDRNLTEKVQARQWTNTNYQYLCLQDIFASIQRSEINGIALEWKFMVLQVNPLQVRKF